MAQRHGRSRWKYPKLKTCNLGIISSFLFSLQWIFFVFDLKSLCSWSNRIPSMFSRIKPRTYTSCTGSASACVGNTAVEDNYSFPQEIFIEWLPVPDTRLSAKDKLLNKTHSLARENMMRCVVSASQKAHPGRHPWPNSAWASQRCLSCLEEAVLTKKTWRGWAVRKDKGNGMQSTKE